MWLKNVSGASFSKVFVQSGPEVVPVEYVQYGVPANSLTNSQFAQISTAPIGSVVPLSSAPNYLPACGTPCVYPASSVAAIQPAASNYVTYKSSVPVVVASHDVSFLSLFASFSLKLLILFNYLLCFYLGTPKV